jgi:hypothetical protein
MTGEGADAMDRATWQQEWAAAWDKYRQAHEAWNSAMPTGQIGLSALLDSIDFAQVEHLKSEVDKAWDRIVELGADRPTA